MGLSILVLVQNRFPFPRDLAPVNLIMHITARKVRPFGHHLHVHVIMNYDIILYHVAATTAGRRARPRRAVERCHEGLYRTIVSLVYIPHSPPRMLSVSS